MGADGSAYVVLGLGITKTTFFVTRSGGVQCPKGHKPPKPGTKYCDECGGRFQETTKEMPTPDFGRWAENLGRSPDELWDMLTDYEGGIDIGAGKKDAKFYAELGVHHVAAIESSERDETHLALGFKLLNQSSERRGSGNSPNGYSVEELTEKAAFLTALAKNLNIGFSLPVQLMLTFYWSV